MIAWELLGGEHAWLSGNCDLAMHSTCAPLKDFARSACGCPCRDEPRVGRILVGRAS